MKPLQSVLQFASAPAEKAAANLELPRASSDRSNDLRRLVASDYIARDGSVKFRCVEAATYVDAAPGNVFTHPAWLRAYSKTDLLIVEALREDADAPRLIFSRERSGLVHEGRLLRFDAGLVEALTERLMTLQPDAAFVIFEDVEIIGSPRSAARQHVFQYQNNWRLPLSEAAKRMSKLLVKSTKRKARGLCRRNPDLKIAFEPAPSRALLDTIASFGRRRMKVLRKRYGISQKEISQLAAAAAEVGHATVVRNRDSILAAELIFIAGDQAYSSTHGYDARYAKSSLGMITLINSIDACAARGLKDFNMLWGDQPYKRHFGADCIKLHTVVIRGSARAFLNAGYLRAVAYFGWRDAKRRLRPLAKMLRWQRP
jgi:CelD/BcsL family acetyltransferase involved in cellulose biosynthesis